MGLASLGQTRLLRARPQQPWIVLVVLTRSVHDTPLHRCRHAGSGKVRQPDAGQEARRRRRRIRDGYLRQRRRWCRCVALPARSFFLKQNFAGCRRGLVSSRLQNRARSLPQVCENWHIPRGPGLLTSMCLVCACVAGAASQGADSKAGLYAQPNKTGTTVGGTGAIAVRMPCRVLWCVLACGSAGVGGALRCSRALARWRVTGRILLRVAGLNANGGKAPARGVGRPDAGSEGRNEERRLLHHLVKQCLCTTRTIGGFHRRVGGAWQDAGRSDQWAAGGSTHRRRVPLCPWGSHLAVFMRRVAAVLVDMVEGDFAMDDVCYVLVFFLWFASHQTNARFTKPCAFATQPPVVCRVLGEPRPHQLASFSRVP